MVSHVFLYHKGCKIVLKVISYDVVNDSWRGWGNSGKYRDD